MDSLIYNQNHIPKEQYRYGFREKKILAELGAEFIADTPQEILEILDKNFK